MKDALVFTIAFCVLALAYFEGKSEPKPKPKIEIKKEVLMTVDDFVKDCKSEVAADIKFHNDGTQIFTLYCNDWRSE